MKRICVLVPTRTRPKQMAECARSFMEMSSGGADVFGLIDSDDPCLGEYERSAAEGHFVPLVSTPGRFGPKVNEAYGLFRLYPLFVFLGDDVRCRTHNWDLMLQDAMANDLAGTGMVFPDDGHRHEQYANHFVISRNILDALGYAWMPGLEHNWGDCVLNTLCQDLGIRRYVPEVLWEHLHPAAGKGDIDPVYTRNDETFYPGQGIYREWENGEGRKRDLEKVRALLNPTSHPAP